MPLPPPVTNAPLPASAPVVPVISPPGWSVGHDGAMRRREFLAQAGALTLAPAAAGTAAPAAGAGFRHGVASFDPTTHGVLLWTRGPADAALRWVVARDRGLREVVARGA